MADVAYLHQPAEPCIELHSVFVCKAASATRTGDQGWELDTAVVVNYKPAEGRQETASRPAAGRGYQPGEGRRIKAAA
jgi:hypothetical protein